MISRLIKELAAETKPEDIPDRYRDIVDITGIDTFLRLADYARGEEIYFPKPENIVIPARNRRIREEYNGYNLKELAARYNVTIPQIVNILKDVPTPGQIDMFEWAADAGKKI